MCLIVPNTRAVKVLAVLGSGLTLLLSLSLFGHFAWWSGEGPGEIFGSGYGQKLYEVTKLTWINLGSGDSKSAIEYFVGVDGLSFPLIILTTVVSFLACLASWNIEHWKINKGIRGYFTLFLLLETGMLGVFCAGLLPVLHLLGSDAPADVLPSSASGAARRKEYAAIKFFIYTLVGSVLMLVVLLAFYFYAPAGCTFNLIEMPIPAEPFSSAAPRSWAALRPLHVRAAVHRLRHQGAGVPVPYVVARRPRRGSPPRSA